MATEPSDAVITRLALATQFYLFASRRSSRGASGHSRILSVIPFDISIENVIGSVVGEFDPTFRSDTEITFPKLI